MGEKSVTDGRRPNRNNQTSAPPTEVLECMSPFYTLNQKARLFSKAFLGRLQAWGQQRDRTGTGQWRSRAMKEPHSQGLPPFWPNHHQVLSRDPGYLSCKGRGPDTDAE